MKKVPAALMVMLQVWMTMGASAFAQVGISPDGDPGAGLGFEFEASGDLYDERGILYGMVTVVGAERIWTSEAGDSIVVVTLEYENWTDGDVKLEAGDWVLSADGVDHGPIRQPDELGLETASGAPWMIGWWTDVSIFASGEARAFKLAFQVQPGAQAFDIVWVGECWCVLTLPVEPGP